MSAAASRVITTSETGKGPPARDSLDAVRSRVAGPRAGDCVP
jgi:hypothetical protein